MNRYVGRVNIMRRTQEQRVAESTRRLVDAALELIAEKGFERTTAAEIGERAGFSRNMVRDRYGTKEALLQALFETEFASRLLPAIRQQRGTDGLGKVLGQLDDLLEAVESEPEMFRAMIVLSFEAPGPLAAIRPWYEQLIKQFQAEMVDHLRVGQRDGSVRDGLDVEREAEVYVSYGIGLCFRWVTFEQFDFAAEIAAWRERLHRHLSDAEQKSVIQSVSQ
jgi:AcrR family transcriptional regulator